MTRPPSTRRDPRYEPARGTATLEFAHPGSDAGRWSGDVTRISICGIGFTIEGEPED